MINLVIKLIIEVLVLWRPVHYDVLASLLVVQVEEDGSAEGLHQVDVEGGSIVLYHPAHVAMISTQEILKIARQTYFPSGTKSGLR